MEAAWLEKKANGLPEAQCWQCHDLTSVVELQNATLASIVHAELEKEELLGNLTGPTTNNGRELRRNGLAATRGRGSDYHGEENRCSRQFLLSAPSPH